MSANVVAVDTRNRAPVFEDQDAETDGVQNESTTRKVGENTEAVAADDALANASEDVADNVGAVVMATDPDPNAETPTYTLGGADATKFRVRANGQIEVGSGTKLDYETKTTYMVTLTAKDSFGESASIAVTIMVNPIDEAPEIMRAPDANVAPEFASATITKTVVENRAAGEDIGNPVAATDNNGDALTYALGGTDAASFDIDAATGQLMTLAALDYETKSTYSVTVTARDSGGLSDSIGVTVTVTDVDETPVITGDAAPNYAENGTGPVATYSATDPESATITWSLEGDDAADFEISSGGELTFKSSPDYEAEADADTDNAYEVTVVASDPAGNEARMEVTITVTEANVAPEFASATTSRTVVENGAAGQDIGTPVAATDNNGDALTYALGGTDAASFDIDTGSGQLMSLAALDYETKATYSVTVTASDSGGLSDSIDVTITVTNVDEMGRVTFWRDGTDATTAAIMVGDMLGGLAEDPDGNVGDTPPITDMYPNITGATWQWAKTMTPGMMDSWMDITGATDAAYTVMDADEGYHLRATAMYDDGEGMGKMASEKTMMVTMNAAPMFESETDTREVAENTVAGEDIGNPVAASDASGGALTYALTGADVASFDIDSDTGPADDPGGPGLRDEEQLRGHGHGHRPRRRKRHDHGDHHRHRRGRDAAC